mmetsp:Transcript_10523/g.33477  ORF Transcript_10523/g.33477 Transcript_10523/m.33477 type:complete len:266 (-) Transcript_10523:231-1028(-)
MPSGRRVVPSKTTSNSSSSSSPSSAPSTTSAASLPPSALRTTSARSYSCTVPSVDAAATRGVASAAPASSIPWSLRHSASARTRMGKPVSMLATTLPLQCITCNCLSLPPTTRRLGEMNSAAWMRAAASAEPASSPSLARCMYAVQSWMTAKCNPSGAHRMKSAARERRLMYATRPLTKSHMRSVESAPTERASLPEGWIAKLRAADLWPPKTWRHSQSLTLQIARAPSSAQLSRCDLPKKWSSLMAPLCFCMTPTCFSVRRLYT